MSASILNKVKDLLSLSEGAGNVNEKASAYKLAQKLLAKHRLTMADIEASGVSTDKESVEVSSEPLYEGKRMITWLGILASGIAANNDCAVYWSGGKVRRLTILGRKSDVEIVRYLYDTVSAQILSFCKVALRRNGGGKTFSNNFKLGAANVVIQRITEATKEVEQDYAGSRAMVLVKRDRAELESAKAKLGLRSKAAVKARFSPDGYAAGRAAGARVNLTRGGLGSSGGSAKRLGF
jgi:hypothetical protein